MSYKPYDCGMWALTSLPYIDPERLAEASGPEAVKLWLQIKAASGGADATRKFISLCRDGTFETPASKAKPSRKRRPLPTVRDRRRAREEMAVRELGRQIRLSEIDNVMALEGEIALAGLAEDLDALDRELAG